MKKKNFKIFDCFMYNNENFILNLRLNILDKFVDKFVIVEGTHDHSGRKKKLKFQPNNFSKFKKKIIYIKVDNFPLNVKKFYYEKILYHENHVRDQFQRNQILKGLKYAKSNDLVIISDIDEIPDLSKIDFNLVDKCTIFYQRVFILKLNLECKSEYPWQGSRILKFKHLNYPQEIRNMKVKRIKPWQIHRFFLNPKYIEYGGWHFSSILPLSKVIKKFKSGAHGEINLKKFNTNILKKKIKEGRDILKDHYDLTKVNLDKTFPDYIVKNVNNFKKFIA